jgi:hypothetical protein
MQALADVAGIDAGSAAAAARSHSDRDLLANAMEKLQVLGKAALNLRKGLPKNVACVIGMVSPTEHL